MAKKESFILVSLKEGKSKKLAHSISNATCRRILNFLAENENATESQVAKELKMPISTVHYNLKLLKESGLVDVEEFHYSKKGREVDHYTLANKYVVIAPRASEKVIDKLRRVLPVAIIVVIIAGFMKVFSKFFIGVASFTSEYIPPATKMLAARSKEAMDVAKEEAVSELAPKAVEVSQKIPFLSNTAIIWFLIGAVLAVVLFFLFSLRKR